MVRLTQIASKLKDLDKKQLLTITSSLILAIEDKKGKQMDLDELRNKFN